jgi:hypothetical protein
MRRLVHAAACRTSSLALLARADELEEQAANRGVLAMLAARLQRLKHRLSCQSSPSTILVKTRGGKSTVSTCSKAAVNANFFSMCERPRHLAFQCKKQVNPPAAPKNGLRRSRAFFRI